MLFLIDENLPHAITNVFKKLGFSAEHVSDRNELRTQPDETIFEYAVDRRAVIVTRDLGFANPIKFQAEKLAGLVIVRFPNEMTVSTVCKEMERLLSNFQEKDFLGILVIEPGAIRRRGF